MGSSVTMVASSVAPCWPPWIRLPASTLRSEMRPAHIGPVEVELGVAPRRLGRLELGAGDGEVGLALVVLGVGNVPGLDQRRTALDLQLGDVDLRLVARDLGLGAFDRDLERPL